MDEVVSGLEVADAAKVCVVSLIGKSQLISGHTKAWKLNSVLNKNVFKMDMSNLNKKNKNNNKNYTNKDIGDLGAIPSSSEHSHDYFEIDNDDHDIKLQRYYDRGKRVVYLNLETLYDSNELIKAIEQKASSMITATTTTTTNKNNNNATTTTTMNIDDVKDEEFFQLFEKVQYKFLRALLLIFSISHIIVVSSPTCSFDIGYVRLFRIIDIYRNKMLPLVVDLMKSLSLPISKDWLYAARPCAPRVLFTFENCQLDMIAATKKYSSSSSNENKKAIEKLQHSLEDQIYQSLRKSYVITNISNNSLFAIPANQEFVYIHRYTMNDLNLTNRFLMSTLIQDCFRFKQQQQPTGTVKDDLNSAASVCELSKLDAAMFSRFLFEHVEIALSEGFNDNIGRANVNALFELPKVDTFMKLFDALHDFYLNEPPKSSKLEVNLANLRDEAGIDVQYSENRCKRAIPLGLKAYQEALPAHYTRSQHEQRLEIAVKVFDSQAKGSAYAECLAQLKNDCEKIWMKHRSCEAVSLTGNPCILELHNVPATTTDSSSTSKQEDEETTNNEETSELNINSNPRLKVLNRKNLNDRNSFNISVSSVKEKPLPTKHHNSNIVTIAASNCGEYQRERRDPFDLKEANFTFYNEFPSTNKKKLIVYEFDDTFTAAAASSASATVSENKNRLILNPNRSPSPAGGVAAAVENLNPNPNQNDFSKIIGKEPARIDTMRNYEDMFPPLQNNSNSQTTNASSLDGNKISLGVVSADEKQTTNQDAGNSSQHSEMASLIKETSHQQLAINQPLMSIGRLLSCSFWSLLSIGKASEYNPSVGLNQPGFLAGFNYLIPWEIGVTQNSTRMLCERQSRRNRNKAGIFSSTQKDQQQQQPPLLKFMAYIGMEYECPLGHRFICSGPDRTVKLQSNGNLKHDAYKLLYSDMPLYTACPCRDSKDSTPPFMAQMMRMFVVTPLSTVCKYDALNSRAYFANTRSSSSDDSRLPTKLSILFKPQVQPNPSPCPIFSPPCARLPIDLPENNIWILRLPYIYMNEQEQKPYYRPKDIETLNNSKVLKGTFCTSLSY